MWALLDEENRVRNVTRKYDDFTHSSMNVLSCWSSQDKIINMAILFIFLSSFNIPFFFTHSDFSLFLNFISFSFFINLALFSFLFILSYSICLSFSIVFLSFLHSHYDNFFFVAFFVYFSCFPFFFSQYPFLFSFGAVYLRFM